MISHTETAKYQQIYFQTASALMLREEALVQMRVEFTDAHAQITI